MKKAPTKDDFRYDSPNVGFDSYKYIQAIKEWAKEAETYIKRLEHHRDTTVGLYATDRPRLVHDPKNLMFRINDI